MREWTHTLPSGLPLWELKSQWTSKSSERSCRGQNSLDWKALYIIKNLLKRRCLKGTRMIYLGTYNISYGQKKGQESNCQFDSQPLKVRNRPDFLMCKWHATYCWKSLDKGYNFALDFTLIRGLHTKLWASKVVRVPISGIFQFGSQVGSPKTK